ncbi:LOW QUALITY PROTEIN: T-cell surface glycoprotein CD8 beta chain-like [Tachysurus vachellii]|uniref:LOW QUALITY PROTEIN: T-cell surface glycoprotein CD8 beta chain-like n=1 Tax=Tachysurus vachellii TaxID=175792 RepID=UPI00296ACC9D|nr:LOW QUALITY PROTEIN: T-cell surface glycoprotein CD8 beta chain-like [Tachysurus vachellii]
MIRLFVALCALFSLFTAVKTSDIKEIDVITVKRGEDVTMKCNTESVTKKDNVVWYRQSSGKLPQYFAKLYKNNLGYKFDEGFNDSRFSISVNDNKFDLSIKKTTEDDKGEYFCGEMEGNVVKFTSGTRLQFEDKEMTNRNTSGTTHRDSSSSPETNASSSNHQIPTNQTAAAADDVLNYAAVSFAKTPSSSRTSRAKSHEDVYAHVKIK